MSQFFKYLFASCLGTALCLICLLFFGICSVTQMATAFENKSVSVTENSVLELKFDRPVPEKTNNLDMGFSFDEDKILGLHDIVAAIRMAKDDPKIKGIYLNCMDFPAGRVTESDIREALVEFKTSGKFIIAWNSIMTQNAYHLASVADSVIVNPSGMIDFRGYSAMVPFFKNMLDKLEIEMQIYYAGKFKSATEPFRLQKMSAENRLQIREFIEVLYGNFLGDISQSRGVSVAELRRIADQYLIKNPTDAVKYRLADATGFEDRAHSAIRSRLGIDAKEKIKKVSMEDYFAAKGGKKIDFGVKDKVAVVLAEGTINIGDDEPGAIMDGQYVPLLRKLRRDDAVKAIVLRVNSGGGSALASDNILREIDLCREAGKPVITSMGDYAASGGYLIACHSDSIFAEKNTLTGSIGVFLLFPNMTKMFRNKLGIEYDTVKTGKFSAFGTTVLNYTPEEHAILQSYAERTYEEFLQKVATGRGKTRDQIHEVAQGRVWTGQRAKELGLVDEIGGLDRAISAAAAKAGLTKYRTSEYPATQDPIQKMLDKLMKKKTDDEISAAIAKSELGEFYEQFRWLKELKSTAGQPQMRVPFLLEIR